MGAMLRGTVGGVLHAAWSSVKPSPFVPRRPSQEGVRYGGQRRGVPPLMDVYLPDGTAPPAGYPSVVVVHGGAFLIGSRQMRAVRFLATRLCEAGFAVACPDYRLLFRGGPLDTQLDDVAEMLRYWRDRASTWGVDPDGIALCGLSAGGALALLHAAASTAPLRAVVGIYGLYDFQGLSGPGVPLMRRLLLQSNEPGVWLQESAVAHAADVAAPLLLVHGTQDRLVPYPQAQAVADARRDLAHSTVLATYQGLPHGWLQDPERPESEAVVRQVVQFLQTPDSTCVAC